MSATSGCAFRYFAISSAFPDVYSTDDPTGVSIARAVCSLSEFGMNCPPTRPSPNRLIAATNAAAAIPIVASRWSSAQAINRR